MVDHGTGHKYSSSFQLPASFAGQFTHGCSRTHIDVYDSVDVLIYIYNYNEITIIIIVEHVCVYIYMHDSTCIYIIYNIYNNSKNKTYIYI